MNVLFPVYAIERNDFECLDRIRFETVYVYTDTGRMGAWNVKRLDAAVPAEVVLRHARIKRVGLQIVFAAEQPKIFFGYDQADMAGLAANAAIALIRLDRCRRVDLKLYSATMAATSVSRHGATSAFSFVQTTI